MSGGITKISPSQMISEMHNWLIEINSSYNDGWTIKHYQDQLAEIYAFVDRSRMTEEERNFEMFLLSLVFWSSLRKGQELSTLSI